MSFVGRWWASYREARMWRKSIMWSARYAADVIRHGEAPTNVAGVRRPESKPAAPAGDPERTEPVVTGEPVRKHRHR